VSGVVSSFMKVEDPVSGSLERLAGQLIITPFALRGNIHL
jgi:hypothetical protein